MNNLISTFILIVLAQNSKNKSSFVIKDLKKYKKKFFQYYCFISYKIESEFPKPKSEPFINSFEPVVINPSKLIEIEVKKSNQVLKTFVPEYSLRVKPTTFFEQQKNLILFLFLLFLFICFYII